MAELVAEVGVEREKGYLYYISKSGDVARSKPRVKDSQEIVAKVGIEKEKGWLYYLDKEGNVSRAKMTPGKNKIVK